MSITVTPHLNFQGQARAALAFYHAVFGGQLALVTYADMGNVQDPVDAEHIIWGQVAAADGFRIMACDLASGTPWQPGENACFVSLRGKDAKELARRWESLAVGAAVLRDLSPAPWTPLYGMLKDRFGITWVVDVEPAPRGA
ncbi:VOC family protein [Massilia sp. G4R7]|uniref:VOC family protein n=1 Tax=Massilia phyllostachyos TaxID=2898585 RepID=A0ABS8Q1Q7_9BURK|nr:VOC family protein [Massilia phyllostachyos]MCD2515681.1 VOC family protein [Massilia phyllostachyos]